MHFVKWTPYAKLSDDTGQGKTGRKPRKCIAPRGTTDQRQCKQSVSMRSLPDREVLEDFAGVFMLRKLGTLNQNIQFPWSWVICLPWPNQTLTPALSQLTIKMLSWENISVILTCRVTHTGLGSPVTCEVCKHWELLPSLSVFYSFSATADNQALESYTSSYPV